MPMPGIQSVISVDEYSERHDGRDGMVMHHHITSNRWKSEWELEQEQRMLNGSRL